MTGSTAIETPSGKGEADENFPVGSWVLPAHLRPHIKVFYGFARAIDDIADNPVLTPADKIARLSAFEAALDRPSHDPALGKAEAMRVSLLRTGVSGEHCRDLIAAFRQDAVKLRYDDWNELMDYCNRSAAPVGRYLLDLHGEDRALYPALDALCNALQVLNHLQDCGDDYRALDRVYLPQDWMAEAGTTVDALGSDRCSAGLRRVIDRALDGVNRLLAEVPAGYRGLRSRRLAVETAVIDAIARALAAALRRRDPLAERVVLPRGAVAAAAAAGLLRAVWR